MFTTARVAGRLRQAPLTRWRAISSQSHDSLVEFGNKHVTKGLGRQINDVMTKGEGSYVAFGDGRKMLDFTTGIGVTNLGHCHPKVSAAAAKQCMELVHGQCSLAFNEPYLQLIDRLLPIMPHKSLDSFFFWNSGSEAIEAAIKMARTITGKQNIITMQGGYHGRTFGAMAVTKSKTVYSEGFHPLMPGVFSAPYPYFQQLGLPPNVDQQALAVLCVHQLELVLQQQTSPGDTAAILIEPFLGEGGYVQAPPEFLRYVRALCDAHNILLIIDEVQSGFGRTGKMFNIEYSGVRPDIMTCAKGLANGFPLSGVVSRKELTDKLKPGSLGGTYAGNAVACAAAVAVADAFKEEKILENVAARSKQLLDALNGLKTQEALKDVILDVRGAGLMVAVEFRGKDHVQISDDPWHGAPHNLASRIAKRCHEKGLLILTTSVFEVIRFIPPLNISQQDMDKGIEIFVEAVEEVVREG